MNAEVYDLVRVSMLAARRRSGFRIGNVDVEDLVQEAAIHHWQTGADRFDESRASLSTFLYGKSRWILLDFIRSKSRKAEYPITQYDAEGDESDNLPPVEETPESVAIENEKAKRGRLAVKIAHHVLSSIDDPVCEASLLWTCVDEMSSREVAKILGVHPSNVSRGRERAVARVRDEIERVAT